MELLHSPIAVPDSVTSIASDAFFECNYIRRVNITDIEAWCKINFADNASNPLWCGAFLSCDGANLLSIAIPDTVTEVKPHAFEGCYFVNLYVPSEVTTIGRYAFDACEYLTHLYYEDTKAQWDEITVEEMNYPLKNAIMHFKMICDYSDNCPMIATVIKPATCTESGETLYRCAINSEHTFKKEVPSALGHKLDSGTVITESTCTKNGENLYKCTREGCDFQKTGPAKLKEHTPVIVNEKAPEVGVPGYTGDIVCSVCGKLLENGEEIEALDPSDVCDHMCHKDGFLGFIWKIINFFQKLFGINSVCECGAAQY